MKVAVYGTLRRGERANNKLSGLEYLGTDHIHGTLYNLGWYPGLRLEGSTDVKVEVYEVLEDREEETLASLDYYEGYRSSSPESSLYLRKSVETVSGQEVLVYEYNNEVSVDRVIATGDWCNRSPA